MEDRLHTFLDMKREEACYLTESEVEHVPGKGSVAAVEHMPPISLVAMVQHLVHTYNTRSVPFAMIGGLEGSHLPRDEWVVSDILLILTGWNLQP